MNSLRLLLSFVRRDALVAASYKIAFLAPLGSVFFAVPILYFLAQVFEGTEAGALSSYGGAFFAFILLGMAFQDYVTMSMSNFLSGVRDHQLMGTMEIVMLSPTPVPQILLFSSIWGYLFTSVRFALYVFLGLLFGLDLSGANLLSFAVLTVTAVVSFAALGILGAAATLIIKQGATITSILTAATLALGGVAYPISVLPGWLQTVALMLPFTHALEGVRKSLMTGATIPQLATELTVLTVFGAVLFPLSLWVFSAALRHAKANGTLGQY
ncbi:MAG: ABC transporter permease [Pseudomonadota bacterium]|jgi:ABC-2 type transport system permease protein